MAALQEQHITANVCITLASQHPDKIWLTSLLQMNTSVGTDNSEDSVHSPGTSPVASPASDAGSITTVASSTHHPRHHPTQSLPAILVKPRFPSAPPRRKGDPCQSRPRSPRCACICRRLPRGHRPRGPSLRKERPCTNSSGSPAFPRLSPSQLPENAIDEDEDDDDDDEDMIPPASLIAVLPVKSRPGSRGAVTSGNMRLPRYPKNINHIVHDQWQKVPERAPNCPANPKYKQLQRVVPDEAGSQIHSAAGEVNAVGRLLRTQSDTTVPALGKTQAPPAPVNGLHIYGSNPSCHPIGNTRPVSRQTSKLQPVEYDAGEPLLRVVGFEYSPNRSLSDPDARSSLVVEAMTRSPTIITDEVPRPLFELAPGWGEQPRKAPPSPAESDMGRAAFKGQAAGHFGEVTITPFRGKRRARDSVSSGSVDELYLASERAALRFCAERDGSSPCGPRPSSAWRRLGLAASGGAGGWPFERLRESLPRPKTATGTTTTWLSDEKQRPITRAGTPLDWRPSTAADDSDHHDQQHHSRKFREGGFHDRLAHGATKIGSLYRRLLSARQASARRQEQH
ncbi:hypothetical protein MCOR02_000897 [Pyricularia oryzae]|nr:hypothetical protein MCOR02_000897 [Pyricularia oryzae]